MVAACLSSAALGGLSSLGGISGASAADTQTVQIDQYTFSVPTGTVSPTETLRVEVSGGIAGTTVSLKGNALVVLAADGISAQGPFGSPGSATFSPTGTAVFLAKAYVGGLVGPEGTVDPLRIVGEVQLPGRSYQPVFVIDAVEPIRFNWPQTVRAGQPFVLGISGGLPNSPVDVLVSDTRVRSITLDSNGQGSAAITFTRPQSVEVRVVMRSTSGRDLRSVGQPLTVTPTEISVARSSDVPATTTFSLRPYTLTIPTGVVYTDEIVEVVVSGGTPGTSMTVIGPYIAGDTATFDAGGLAVVRFRAAEIDPGFVAPVGVNIYLPDRVGFQVVGEFFGIVRPTVTPTTVTPTTVTPTTTPATTVASGGSLVLSAPAQVAVGEAFQAQASGLRPGAIVAFTAGSNELGWATANGSGVASVTNSVWQRGSFTLTVNEITDGVTVVRTASRSIQVGARVASTLPEANGFSIAAPTTISLGQTFTVTVSGLDVDSIIEVQAGDVTLGWALADVNGNATVSSSLWVTGSFPLTITEWRYGAKLGSQTAPLVVS